MASASSRRLLGAAAFGIGGLVVLGLVGRLALPVLQGSLFPVPSVEPVAAADVPSPEVVARALDQAIVGAGGDLPPKPGAGEAAVVPLPQGLSPGDLQDRLREDPRLAGAEVYVTRADALLWRLRVFAGSDRLLLRELRPWLPEAPPHPPGNPPELVLLVDLRDGEGERALTWRSPLGVILQPFAPSTLRLAGEAARASRSVVGAVTPGEPVTEQIQAVPHISGVLVEEPFDHGEDALLATLAEQDLVLLDGCPRGCLDPDRARDAGVSLLRVAVQLGRDDGAGEQPERALARNLAAQWGYGLVVAPGSAEGLRRAEALVEAAKGDGLPVVFVEEAARQHGLLARPG